MVAGLFNDRELYVQFFIGVKAVGGIRELYWHVSYMSEVDQKAREGEMPNWVDAMTLDAKIGINLLRTIDVADVNLRVIASFARVGFYRTGAFR